MTLTFASSVQWFARPNTRKISRINKKCKEITIGMVAYIKYTNIYIYIFATFNEHICQGFRILST